MTTTPNTLQINYVIHIASSAESVWDALTNPEALRRNWGRIQSDWKPGSEVSETDESGKVLWRGVIRRSERPRLLAYTFDVIGSGETSTDVTIELSPPASDIAANVSITRLILSQVGFTSSSKLFAGCACAWPEIISSFKTYVEIGRPLGFAWKH